MKITGLRCVQVEIPLEKPIRTAIHDVRTVGCVLVYLDSDEGLSGEAYNFTMNAVRLDVLQAMRILIPPAWQSMDTLDPDVRAFYEFFDCILPITIFNKQIIYFVQSMVEM